jgi:hypothetical protein
MLDIAGVVVGLNQGRHLIVMEALLSVYKKYVSKIMHFKIVSLPSM